MKCWAARSTSCRRRRGGCCWPSTSMVTAECERQKMERSDYRFSRRDVRGVHGLGRYAVENPSAPAGGDGVPVGPSRRARPELRLRAYVRAPGRQRQARAARADRGRNAEKPRVRRKEVGANGRVVGVKSAPSRRGVGCGETTRIANIHAGSRGCTSSRSRKAHIRAHGKTVTTS